MGKNLISQARGRGGPTYRAPSFRYAGRLKHRPWKEGTVHGNVVDLIHCQGHSSPLALIKYEDGDTNLMAASEGMRVGDTITHGNNAELESGNVTRLVNLPEGTLIYNIEGIPGDGGKFARASGTFAKIISKLGDKIIVKLPSRKNKEFHPNCRATIGIIAGGGRLEKPLLKAGRSFYKKKAKNKLWPVMSGCAMNAVDHPFGNKRTSRKSKARPAPKNAPPGRKVGMIRPRRTGRKTGKTMENTRSLI